jgi:hypothetical protein
MVFVPALPEQAAVLHELQQQFVREVLYRDSVGLLPRVLAKGLSADRRVAIYRNNTRENFALALEAAFPLLLACMGGDEFRMLAWSYQRACPSPAGNLFHVGERLPNFLAEHLTRTGDECLIDVARLEGRAGVAGGSRQRGCLDLAALRRCWLWSGGSRFQTHLRFASRHPLRRFSVVGRCRPGSHPRGLFRLGPSWSVASRTACSCNVLRNWTWPGLRP